MSAAAEPAWRTLILAPIGRDAGIARSILNEAEQAAYVCGDMAALVREIEDGADAAIITEEALRVSGFRELVEWIAAQPPWSDFPFVILTRHGGGLERNPAAAELTRLLGNVTFLERPFHPTTLVSVVESSRRGRKRQYECRRLNEELELRVDERTRELAAANRQLLNQIEERERVESTLRQMQRLEAVGQLTSGVAHDFNNLLTVIIGNLGFLEKDVALAGLNGKSAKRLSYMRIAAERGAKLTDQLLSFSRRQRLEPKVLDLNDVLAGMHQLLQSTMGGSIHIETDFSDDLWSAMVDPTQLELALNLAINARDAMQVGGSLKVSTRNVSVGSSNAPEEPPPGDYVEVRVSDTGSGMAEEIRNRVFEPFFTTKEIGKGSGLGLSQVLGFAKQSNGGVRIDSTLGKGTAVSIYLPRSELRAQQDEVEGSFASPAQDHKGGDILLVDDDSAVREVAASMLGSLGYRVHQVGSAGAALDFLCGGAVVDLILMDFAMPGMNGAELARRVQAMRPDLPILFVTGFADRSALTGFSAAQIIGKPFTLDELGKRIGATLTRTEGDATETSTKPAG